MNVVITQMKLPFLDDFLALRLYACQEQSGNDGAWPAPVIVMCHDFCGVQEMLLPEVAHTFARAGYVIVTFDYRGFGESTGERGRLVVARQQEDIRAVINWVHNNPLLDESRIALWGTGLGGGHALCVAYGNVRVCCVVSQMPMLDGPAIVTRGMNTGTRQVFLKELQERAVRQRIDDKELWVSVSRLIHDPASRNFFLQQRRACPAMVSRMPYLTLHELCHYRASPFAAGIHQPTLLIMGEYDHLTSMEQVDEVYEGLNGIRYLYRVAGAARYDLYRAPWREEVLAAQLDWFKVHI